MAEKRRANDRESEDQALKMTGRRRHWLAWMALCAALAIHVADEALTGFLDRYKPIFRETRLPIFTFDVWLSLLIFAVVALSAASYFVWKGRWAMRPISHVFAVFMLVNGLLHIAHSVYMREFMPGVYTSPLLIAASVALIVYTWAYQRERARLAHDRLRK
jgi:cation transport ATPase